MKLNSDNNVLVTGGAGFLGSHLCERLLKSGMRVTCLDNFDTGRKENILHLLEDQLFTFIKHDIREPLELTYDVDMIYNLACPASPPHYQLDPIYTFETSVLGTRNLLRLAVDKQAKFLQASTSEVYGDPLVHPQPENYWGNVNTIGVRSCYDEGKRAAETLVFDYSEQLGVDAKIVRIFNTYGPRMRSDDGRVVSNFIVQALQNIDLTIYGDGEQTRSFCFYTDLIDGFITVMEKGRKATPYNLGNPDEFTMKEPAKLVLEQTESNSSIIYRELPQDDPKQRKPIIQRAKDELAWEPKVKLRDGLIKAIEYFKSEIKRGG